MSVGQGSELVQVSAFKLAKPYRAALFGRVAAELALRMKEIARQTGGDLGPGRTVSPAGMKSHSYEVTSSDQVDEYTFLLAGRREYQLLCRRKASGGVGTCKDLLASFTLAAT